ncbi:MAG: S26 family signal peptidase [Luteibacter sp.]
MAGGAQGRRWPRWAAIGVLAALMTGHSAVAAWQRDHAFMVNTSESLPNWAFFVEKNAAPRRGQYVFFLPPHTPLLVRHFGERHGSFGKQVLGLPGDIITHDGPAVLVNSTTVAVMKPRTRTGEVLTPGPTGVVPQGCYYVGTGHKDGFDSRYAEIGFVCRRQILGTGTPIL